MSEEIPSAIDWLIFIPIIIFREIKLTSSDYRCSLGIHKHEESSRSVKRHTPSLFPWFRRNGELSLVLVNESNYSSLDYGYICLPRASILSLNKQISRLRRARQGDRIYHQWATNTRKSRADNGESLTARVLYAKHSVVSLFRRRQEPPLLVDYSPW